MMNKQKMKSQIYNDILDSQIRILENLNIYVNEVFENEDFDVIQNTNRNDRYNDFLLYLKHIN